MEAKWKRLKSEAGPNLKLFKARFDYMLNPRNGATEKMIVLESADAANTVALNAMNEIIFVRQYRFGIEMETFELPGGIVEPEEPHLQAAQRELTEETGYGAGAWNFLGSIGSNPVFMDSYIHHWMATDVAFIETPSLDPGEDIKVESMTRSEAQKKLSSGFFKHPHTVSGLQLFFAKFP